MHTARFRQLAASDTVALRALRTLYGEAFGETLPNNISNDHLTALLCNPAVVFFVAEDDGAVVGGATAYLLPSLSSAGNELYLYDIAVEPGFQRRGIGSGLLAFIKDYCREQRILSLFVQADAADGHARNFYLKNGGVERDVRQYEFSV